MQTIIKQRLLDKFVRKCVDNSHRMSLKQTTKPAIETIDRMTCLDPGFDKVYHRFLAKIK